MANYSTFALVNNDITADNKGNISLVSDDNCILQNVKTALALWYGEYQYDTTLGVDYANILGTFINEAILYTEIKSAIYQVQGVVAIGNIIAKWNNNRSISRIRELTVYVKVSSSNVFQAVSVNF